MSDKNDQLTTKLVVFAFYGLCIGFRSVSTQKIHLESIFTIISLPINISTKVVEGCLFC